MQVYYKQKELSEHVAQLTDCCLLSLAKRAWCTEMAKIHNEVERIFFKNHDFFYVILFSLELCNGLVFLPLHEGLWERPHIFYSCIVPSSL